MIALPSLTTQGFGKVSLRLRMQNLRRANGGLGRGIDIPLTHKDRFPQLTNSQDRHNPRTNLRIVADLINRTTGTWKPDLIRSLYPHQMCNEIFSYPISKTGCIND